MPSVGLLSSFFAIFELLFCFFEVALLFADFLAAARASLYRCSNNLAAFGVCRPPRWVPYGYCVVLMAYSSRIEH